MYAIVDIAGQQFKVSKEQQLFVHRLESEIGSQVDFDKVLLIDNDSSVVVGAPIIEGAMITAKVLEHLKGDKVIVFKKKRRKGYKVKNGHRQFFTKIEIEEILETGAKPKVAKKQAAKPVVKEVAAEEGKQESEVVKAEVKTEAKVAETPKPKASTAKKAAPEKVKKETAPKKSAAPKKPAAKKTESKAAPKKTKKTDDTK